MKVISIIGILATVIFSCSQVKTAEDFVFAGSFTEGLEGPAVDREGNLYFVNPNKLGAIARVSIMGQLEIYIDSLPNGSVANGIRIGSDGTLYFADYINHNILAVQPNRKAVEIFAHDSTMNQPNDLAIMSNGIILASDPNWKKSNGNLWRIDAAGQTTLLESNMGTTNGIEVAPGDSLLYVNESMQRKIWVYDLSSDGEVSNKRLLMEFEDFGLDGMRTDTKGNLYVARYGKGVIAVISPQGVLLEEIQLKGQKPTNIAFGGMGGKTCYVTCQDRGWIETFEADHSGRSWTLIR
ncbi:MAG: SMP-30/gluconolactonase/LRE family protein [Reichenbachiella sp.]|uniref:SMP-30/gluconolactonase/LRE family protein n=1 Tax=Reichenbachiella sp. TaxID=2184521 RepID=UPI0032630A66